jgi:hypothetical protein
VTAGLLAELKRRNVIRMAGLYLVGAWLSEAARPVLQRLAKSSNPSALGEMHGLVDALEGRGDKHMLAQRMAALPFNSLLDQTSGNALEDHMVAATLVLLGEKALALDYMERNARELGNSMDWAGMLPVMDPIRCEPRFRAIVEQLKTTDPHYTKVCTGKP